MKNQKNAKKPSPQSMLYAFESFGLEASERELDEALIQSGDDPHTVLNSASAAIQRAIGKRQVKKESTEPEYDPREYVPDNEEND